jgi:hypothetical protein
MITTPADHAIEARRVARRVRRDVDALGTGIFAVGLGTLIGWALWCGRGVWFYIDEWVVITRYHDGHWLTPFNGHLSLVPIAVYRGLLATVRYDFTWYRVVGVVCYAAAAIAVFCFARTRVHPVFAALAALAVAWSSQARLLVMFPLLLNFTVPIAAVVAIWMLLERDTLRADVLASLAMALALASSAVGLLAPVAVGVDLLLRRERRWRRWLVFVPPVALWLAWYAAYGVGKTGAGGGAGSIVSFAGRESLEMFAAFVGLSKPAGAVLFVAFVAFLVVAHTRWRTFDRRAAVILVTLVAFLFLTAAGRANVATKFHVPAIPPDTDRYLWVDDLLIICLLVQCLRGRRIHAVAYVAALALVVGNGIVLGRHLGTYRDNPIVVEREMQTAIVAVDALGSRADPSRLLQLGILPVPTRDYLGLARHYGSPAAGVPWNRLGSERARVQADGWLVHDLGVRLTPVAASDGSACRAVPRAGPTRTFTMHAPATVVVHGGTSPASVAVRRLARHFDAPALGDVAPGENARVDIPRDNSGWPWYVQVTGAGASVSECG